MPPSFRNRFRRRSPVCVPSSSLTGSGVGGGGISYPGKSFLQGRSSLSNASSRRSSSSYHQHQQQNGHPPLATFDACIEACDALAAASSSSSQKQRQRHDVEIFSTTGNVHDGSEEDGSDNQSSENGLHATATTTTAQEEHHVQKNGNEEVIKDCSVLVSPDGALLFTASQSPISISLASGPSSSDANANNTDQASNSNTDDSNNNEAEDRYPWTKIPTEDRDGVILEEEYESAIICGNDLTPRGDYDSNGFTGRGWNHDAATLALTASQNVLQCMEVFVEELAMCRKEEAACMSGAVGKVSGFRERLLQEMSSSPRQMRRMGPILSSGTNLSVAMEAMEDYYANSAEGALDRWRMACSERHPSQQSTTPIELKEFNSNGKEQDPEGRKRENSTSQRRSIDPELIQGMLPKLRLAFQKATSRTSERERAIYDTRSKVSEAETILQKQKDWSASQWQRVADEECNIDRLYAIKKMEQHEFYEEQRRKQEGALLDQMHNSEDKRVGRGAVVAEAPLSEEVWEMVQGVATSMEDFGHTGYSPRSLLRKPNVEDVIKQRFDSSGHAINPEDSPQRRRQLSAPMPPPTITRADVEKESELADLLMVAMAADESVEDAAGKMLNIMSKGDTTLRSARLAAESCLLSQCNAARAALRSLVAVERASLEERMKRLEVLEAAVDAIDVRKDIDNYIQADKSIPGGRSRAGEDDDGGIAAALAVLNSHGESGNADSPRKYRNIERPSYFQGWAEDGGGGSDNAEDDEIEPELFGDVIKMLFEDNTTASGAKKESLQAPDSPGSAPDSPRRGKRERSASESHDSSKEEQITLASNALSEKSKQGQSFRKSVLYELNNQRSKKTQVDGNANFDSLCRLFNAFLSGCGRESVDVSNAKMLMILSQTFYFADQEREGSGGNDAEPHNEGRSTTKDRQSRVYVKSKICHHDIWSDEDFWDQAVYQCVSESLAKSGVLLNYIKSTTVDGKRSDQKNVKWHDLAPDEYVGAAAQVHSVVFAQLGTLSHSMIELGCGIPRACNFVRRLSIRYQLPLSLRITLIQHLTKKRGD